MLMCALRLNVALSGGERTPDGSFGALVQLKIGHVDGDENGHQGGASQDAAAGQGTARTSGTSGTSGSSGISFADGRAVIAGHQSAVHLGFRSSKSWLASFG